GRQGPRGRGLPRSSAARTGARRGRGPRRGLRGPRRAGRRSGRRGRGARARAPPPSGRRRCRRGRSGSWQGGERGAGGLEGRVLIGGLAEEGLDGGLGGDGGLEGGVAARLVGAEQDEVALALVERQGLAQAGGGLALRGRRQGGEEAREAAQHVDGGVATAGREGAVEQD